MKIGNLGLQIPVQNPSKSTQISMEQGSIKKWRATLPMADTGATAKKLFLLLNEMNQVVLEPIQRFEILELLRPPLQLICQALRKHYINQTTALTKQKLTIANLAQTLQLETVNGYKAALEELHINNKEPIKTLSQLIIYRIMCYYNAISLRSYQVYSQVPRGIWQELHLLYILARKEGLLENKVEGSIVSKEQDPTILACYVHSILLAASNPYQWRQNEQDAINNVLRILVPLAALHNNSAAKQSKPGLFKLDLKKDEPPEPLGLQQIEFTRTTIILDVEKVCVHLANVLKTLDENETKAKMAHDKEPEYELSATTLTRLVNSWNTVTTRQYKRFGVNCKMQAVFGLSATHHYVSNAKPFDPNIKAIKQKAVSQDNMEPLGSKETIPQPNTVLTEPSMNLELLESEAATENADDSSIDKFVIYNCSLLDVSPTGFCLNWECDTYPLVQPGEIIATRTSEDATNDKHSWNIGVIRWLKHTTDDCVRVGVQLLAAQAKAVGAQLVKGDVSAGYFLRCLMLPGMEVPHITPSLVTPTLPFKQGKTINLYTMDNPTIIKAKLTKQIDATSSYRQFEYITEQAMESMANKIKEQKKPPTNDSKTNNATDKPENNEETDKPENNEETDKFNSIWDQL